MREWRVTFEGAETGSADDFVLSFVDMRDIVGEFRRLKYEVMMTLTTNADKYDNYHVIGNTTHVVSPDQQIVDPRIIWAVIGTDKEGSRFGFLIAKTNSNILIIGVWPKSYAETIKGSERAFQEILTAILAEPYRWKRVDLISPTGGL